MKTAAYIVSILFHPVFMPMWIFVFLMENEPVLSLFFAGANFWPIIFILFLNTIVGPLLSIYVLSRQGVVDSMEMPTLRGRSLVYLLSLVYYVLTYILFQRFGMPPLVGDLVLGLILVLALLALISLRYKVSAHMASAGGLLAVVLWMFVYYSTFYPLWAVAVILLSGVIGTARSILGAHDMGELACGLLIGLVGVLLPLSFSF